MTDFGDTTPDDAMTPDEEAAVQLLTPAEIQRVDDCLLSNIPERWVKVARVIALTIPQLPDIPVAFLSLRVKHLAASGFIEAAGNLNRMRYSEVRKRDN